MTIIGLTGKIGAGKDTVGNILVSEHGFYRLAFADALKDVAYGINPIVFEHTTDEGLCSVRLQDFVNSQGWEVAKRGNQEVRRILQALGVAARRSIQEDVWVNAVLNEAKHLLEQDQDVVITDVRFPNEAQAITHLGGTVFRVVRETGQTDADLTETALDKYDFPAIYNTESIDQLHQVVLDVLEITAGSSV